MSKAIHIAVQYIETMCASMYITPINILSEDSCAIHIGYSVRYHIMDAMHIDCDNMIVFKYIQYVLSTLILLWTIRIDFPS